jgi:NAD(P)-dependent dehydrogenase (short-subunit alcohol dehydrogenase family)
MQILMHVDLQHPSGIGSAIAKFLLNSPQKHNLVVLGRDESALQKLEAQAPSQVKILAGDLSDYSLGEQAIKTALSSFGQLDGLIINHGTLGEVKRIADCDLDGFQKTFEVNFFSAVACVSGLSRDISIKARLTRNI